MNKVVTESESKSVTAHGIFNKISVYEDKIYIWNDGEMPADLDSTDKLFMKHSSKPYNPKLANVFFKSGMIEAWGRGFEKSKKHVESMMLHCQSMR